MASICSPPIPGGPFSFVLAERFGFFFVVVDVVSFKFYLCKTGRMTVLRLRILFVLSFGDIHNITAKRLLL